MKIEYALLCDFASEGKSNKINAIGIFDKLSIPLDKESGKRVNPNTFFLVLKAKEFSKGDTFIIRMRPKDRDESYESIEVVNSTVKADPVSNSMGGLLFVPIPAKSLFSAPGEWFIEIESSALEGPPFKAAVFQVEYT